MQVLIFDADPSIDQSMLQYFHLRNYDVTVVRTAGEALDLIHRSEFDCILLDVSTTAEYFGLVEIRQFMRTSAVGFMTAMQVESLVAEAVAEGSIRFQSLQDLIENLEYLPQPIMLAGAHLPISFFRAARDKGLRISTARTLQFAMNLLVDGWCQIIWLHAEIAGRALPDKGVVIQQVGAKQLAILASVLSGSTPSITCGRKPVKAEEFISLFQRIVGIQPAHCGLAEVRAKMASQQLNADDPML
jgi:CheY-like chemotaxis protein